MAGERLEAADVGWHGIEGDRRLALRLTRERGGFPWLTASKLPDLLLFTPVRHEGSAPGDLPSYVRTPEGRQIPVLDEELAAEVERRCGAPVEMTHLREGIFDEANISVITTQTVREIERLAGRSLDIRRFRPNIVVSLVEPNPFQEEDWVGGVVLFGEPDQGPRVSVTMPDARCSIVNFDPDTARSAPEVLKSIVRANQNNAGVYGTVIRTGQLSVGQTISIQESADTLFFKSSKEI